MVRRFGPNFDIVHAQQIAMFSYLTGSLDYALSNPIFILERVTRFVVEYITANSHKKFIFRTIYFFSFFLFENLPMRARSSTRCTRVVRDVEILENLGKEAIMHKRYSRVASLELFSLSKHGKGKNSKNGRNETIYRDEISATICYLLPRERTIFPRLLLPPSLPALLARTISRARGSFPYAAHFLLDSLRKSLVVCTERYN